VDYNILTNNQFEDFYWTGMAKPSPKKEYQKNINMDVFRDYNIVTNRYWEKHKDKTMKDMEQNREKVNQKYWKTHNFNYLTCSFYDEAKEKQFQE
jgi:hypothetical protein